MPSPLGHALGGAAVGLLASGASARWASGSGPAWLARPAVRGALFAILACSPDFDLLVGTHSAQSHSIGAVAIVGLALAAWTRSPQFAAAGAAAYGSHLLFDWIGRDTSPPLGIMALWPLTSEYYMSPVSLLEPVSRRYWIPGFWMHTLKVGLAELLIFGGLAAVAWWWRVDRQGA